MGQNHSAVLRLKLSPAVTAVAQPAPETPGEDIAANENPNKKLQAYSPQ